jgi:hypothetical protein
MSSDDQSSKRLGLRISDSRELSLGSTSEMYGILFSLFECIFYLPDCTPFFILAPSVVPIMEVPQEIRHDSESAPLTQFHHNVRNLNVFSALIIGTDFKDYILLVLGDGFARDVSD